MISKRLFLSPPVATEEDIASVVAAMRSGWLAPVGPDLSGFEADMGAYLGVTHAVGLASGTATIHLVLRGLGVRPGDAVIVPTVTFAASAFPICYEQAVPLFVDIDDSWNLDPDLLAAAIDDAHARGQRVAAVLPVDLYGSPANYADITQIADFHGIPIVEDAAEGLGARVGDSKVGTLGRAAVLSFNGNKIITTSGGGMLVTEDEELATRVRFWSTQSREPYPWYEHREVGFNYRLSNLLAALGRSQLRRIDAEVVARRRIREWYREQLEAVEGVLVQRDPPWGTSNAWLTVARFDSRLHPGAPDRVREALEAHNIEARPVWKPLHQQPAFAASPAVLSGAADALFREGLCLPSGSAITQDDVDRVSCVVIDALAAR